MVFAYSFSVFNYFNWCGYLHLLFVSERLPLQHGNCLLFFTSTGVYLSKVVIEFTCVPSLRFPAMYLRSGSEVVLSKLNMPFNFLYWCEHTCSLSHILKGGIWSLQ